MPEPRTCGWTCGCPELCPFGEAGAEDAREPDTSDDWQVGQERYEREIGWAS